MQQQQANERNRILQIQLQREREETRRFWFNQTTKSKTPAKKDPMKDIKTLPAKPVAKSETPTTNENDDWKTWLMSNKGSVLFMIFIIYKISAMSVNDLQKSNIISIENWINTIWLLEWCIKFYKFSVVSCIVQWVYDDYPTMRYLMHISWFSVIMNASWAVVVVACYTLWYAKDTKKCIKIPVYYVCLLGFMHVYIVNMCTLTHNANGKGKWTC
jgi:hypothetical protein